MIVATGGTLPALAAKRAISTIAIVFGVGDDSVSLGLVSNLARPGGNATGVNFSLGELTAKRFELVRELLPTAMRVAVLVNPANDSHEGPLAQWCRIRPPSTGRADEENSLGHDPRPM